MDQLKALCRNAWKMDLLDFARVLGRPPEQCEESFRRFQRAATALSQLDDETLAMIAQPQQAVTGTVGAPS